MCCSCICNFKKRLALLSFFTENLFPELLPTWPGPAEDQQRTKMGCLLVRGNTISGNKMNWEKNFNLIPSLFILHIPYIKRTQTLPKIPWNAVICSNDRKGWNGSHKKPPQQNNLMEIAHIKNTSDKQVMMDTTDRTLCKRGIHAACKTCFKTAKNLPEVRGLLGLATQGKHIN